MSDKDNVVRAIRNLPDSLIPDPRVKEPRWTLRNTIAREIMWLSWCIASKDMRLWTQMVYAKGWEKNLPELREPLREKAIRDVEAS